MSTVNDCIRESLSNINAGKALTDKILAADDPIALINVEMLMAKRTKREAVIQATRIAQGWLFQYRARPEIL